MRYLHEDGAQVSLSYSSEIIQNLANNEIRNATKLITLTPGFIPGGFEPRVVSENPSELSSFSLGMKAKPAIFPNGEVFAGNGYECFIPILKSNSIQYLRLIHQELRRGKVVTINNKDQAYSEILDGARLELSTEPTQSDDELLIAKVTFPPQASKPIVEIISNEWKYYWSGAQIVDPNEIININMLNLELSLSLVNDSAAGTNPNAINNSFSMIQRLGLGPIDGKYAWDILAALGGVHQWTYAARRMPPYILSGNSTLEQEYTRVPAGIDIRYSARKADAYRGSVSTEWVEAKNINYAATGELNISTMVHPYYPIVGIRIWSVEELPVGSYAQIWISDSIEPDIVKHFPTMEIPIPHISSSGAPALIALPYYLSHVQLDTQNIHVSYRIVHPSLKVTNRQSITISTAESFVPSPCQSMVHIPLGSDKSSAVDEDGRKLYYNKSTIRFYLPKGARRLGNDSNKYLHLHKIEFVNYKSAELGEVITKTGGGVLFTAEMDSSLLLLTGDENSIDQDVSTGDYIHIRGSEDSDELPHGRYLVDNVAVGPFRIWVSPLYPTVLLGGTVTSPILSVYLDDAPSCTLSLYDISEGIAELISLGKDTFSIPNVMHAGALPVNALAGYAGTLPDRNASFPESPYSSDVDLAGANVIMAEGRWYEFRLTKESGATDHFQSNGYIKLWLTEE